MTDVRCQRCNRLLCRIERGTVEAYCRHCKIVTRQEECETHDEPARVIYLSGRESAGNQEDLNLAVRY